MSGRGPTTLEAPREDAGFAVDSATGVDVSLPVAGPGARSFAFIIDWHIRVVLFIAWFVVAALVYNGSWNLALPGEPTAGWFGLVVFPGTLIYFLYHPVLEIAMRGRTPGKRMAGVRLVTRQGAVPTIPAHLIRNVFRLIDSVPVCYALGLVMVTLTKDHVRIGDLAAGTLLVYERREHEGALEHVNPAVIGKRLDVSTAELVEELLQRWQTLDASVRQRLGRTLLARIEGVTPESISLSESALRKRLAELARGSAE
ncbi:MAG: RDD family protein [Steroidobacteraceae bacterium]|nr:RDD family protein [Steroidobacteraceae bacterium]